MNDENSFEETYKKVIGYYRKNAVERFEYFERTKSNHCDYFLKFITPAPGNILDVGSGSGRDSAFFAHRGYHVVAVEPAHELRELAIQNIARKILNGSMTVCLNSAAFLKILFLIMSC